MKKIIYDFNSISNRLLQADFNDYNDVLSKFLRFIDNTEIIYAYIKDCGVCEQDLETAFREVSASYGRQIFILGESDEEEVRNVYAILSYIVEHNIEIHYGVAFGYSSSKHYQDKVKGFNNRVVMVLIRHIECYLTKIGIDMGLDEKVTYSISFQNGQLNIANDGAMIHAVNNLGLDANQLSVLIQSVRDMSIGLPPEDAETVDDSLEVIEAEVVSPSPKKGLLRTAVNGIKAIKGTAEFGAAVAALIQFIGGLM